MHTGRLFTFGCSFTEWIWPTWADLLGENFSESYNYGLRGLGNLGIACRVAEADAIHSFTAQDVVIVQWTSTFREDRWLNGEWLTLGNIFYSNQYPEGFVENFIDHKGCYIRDLAQIHLTKKFLEKIGCNFKFLSMIDYGKNFERQYGDFKHDITFPEVREVYRETLKIILPSFQTICYPGDQTSNDAFARDWRYGPQLDYHPLPDYHVKYINSVLPEFAFTNDQIQNAENLTEQILRSCAERGDTSEMTDLFAERYPQISSFAP